jgi:uncharacterized membrane protein YgcG
VSLVAGTFPRLFGEYCMTGWLRDVEARLDRDGRLHVKERQAMVFNGDWNGGERRFDVPLGQQFSFEQLARLDSASNSMRVLTEGDLDAVDHYGWAEGRTLRWRSRLPSDPEFQNTEFTYELQFSYGNILVPQPDGSYLLDHDFAFADRYGYIGLYTLNLAIDEAWGRPPAFTGRYGPVSLPPGEGFVVRVPLTYQAAGFPADVVRGASASVRQGLVGVLGAGLLVMLIGLIRRERALGRFSPIEEAGPVGEVWLNMHVFSMLPEVVGAAWDNTTAAPEVTAVLARMVGERKLASEVQTHGKGWFKRDVLHLRLLVDRKSLPGYEKTLIDGLFDQGAKETSTDRVRERYKKSGFDPASKIKDGIQRRIAAINGSERAPDKPRKLPTLVLLGAAVALLVLGVIRRPGDLPVALFGVFASVVTYVLAASQAFLWQRRVRNLGPHAIRFLLFVLVAAGALVALLLQAPFRTSGLVLAGLTLLVLAMANSVMNVAKARQSSEQIAQRKRLALARDWFREQLRQPQPQLRDEWFPYLLAFGLGGHMDKWFRAFGGEGAVARSRGYASSGSGSSGPSWSGTGGGGGFSGGGSSGTWAAAAGLMASGVSAPSSSSSGGGGGGGGGSSGGGGGGGW